MVGILTTASIAILNPNAQLGKSRDSKRKADFAQIRAALELYRSDNGHYPRTDWVSSAQGDAWIRDADSAKPFVPNYSRSIPKDPKNNGFWPWSQETHSYAYSSVTDCSIGAGTSYILTTRLENTSDSDINKNIQYGTCAWPAVAGHTGLYTVTSP